MSSLGALILQPPFTTMPEITSLGKYGGMSRQ